MSDVVNLAAFRQDKSKLVWICGQCGCTTFYLRADDWAECASCKRLTESGGEWRKRLPEPDKEAPPVEGFTRIVTMQTVEQYRDHTLEELREGWGKLAVLAAFWQDGTVSRLFAPMKPADMTDEQREEIERHVATLRRMLLGLPHD